MSILLLPFVLSSTMVLINFLSCVKCCIEFQTRPLIGMVNVEEELRILEEKANEAYGAYKEQLDTKAKLEAENVELEAELAAVKAKISAEQVNSLLKILVYQ